MKQDTIWVVTVTPPGLRLTFMGQPSTSQVVEAIRSLAADELAKASELDWLRERAKLLTDVAAMLESGKAVVGFRGLPAFYI